MRPSDPHAGRWDATAQRWAPTARVLLEAEPEPEIEVTGETQASVKVTVIPQQNKPDEENPKKKKKTT